MKKFIPVLFMFASITTASNQAYAVTFTPAFSDFPFPGTQFTVDAAANTYYTANYGITVENSYLYRDSRDTFDGIGVANGEVSEIGTPQTGRINFLDTTDFVIVDYLAILNTTYSAFKSDGTLITSILQTPGNGTFNFAGGGSLISYITFASTGGFGTVSGLTYNYDGITDGRNDDLNPIPLPAALPLMASALGLFGFGLRRNKI